MTQQISQVFVIALAILSFGLSTSSFATNQAAIQQNTVQNNAQGTAQSSRNTAQNTTTQPASPSTPAPLRQATAQGATATNTAKPSDATARANLNKAIEQAVAKRSVDMQKRLTQLETANQTALAQNQELQLKNDNLTVQVQVLQSERSAQMFLYGAVTLGLGVIIGVILYNFMSTRRRRF
ncbi:hypothetical protein MKI79_08645 [Acinetobacter sp. A3.8]|uniref:SH3 domain protein n=1 Tax=Acinetobacter sedimenti TaxID=2919922 RepID=A0A9X1X2U1_9GAMM|nr:hypothetical protein [Acinetobacter sedimenti]MCJ8146966.1 hypothetical protein [Acinetobacter sedimenti]